MSVPAPAAPRTIAIVGAGFSGALLAMKLTRLKPDWRILLVEEKTWAGRGLAYGACSPSHLLNVPVTRMETGLKPAFADWLDKRRGALAEALTESGGDLGAAFVPRALWGAYMTERLGETVGDDRKAGLTLLRGEVMRLLDPPRRGVVLADGRSFEADAVVLATGNLPPRAPFPADSWLHDDPAFVTDPWTREALEELDPEAPVLMLGTALTMADIALKLADLGHRGPITAVSRRGLLPTAHRPGGDWAPFLGSLDHPTPLTVMKTIRAEAAKAIAAGTPWQRVVDAVRPAVARVWSSWTLEQRRQFLRHARPRWDVHRHRMAPRVAAKVQGMIDSGALSVKAGRLRDWRRTPQGLAATLHPRGGGEAVGLIAARVINCTGPRADLDGLEAPLFASLFRRGMVLPDLLGQGLETEDCAVIGAGGDVSDWLYAVGPLTRPAWWEITAVPEITAQVDRLAHTLAQDAVSTGKLDALFLDLGAGI